MKKKRTTIEYAKALYELTKGMKGEKMHLAVAEFVRLLTREHKLKKGERIVLEFVKYAKKMEGAIPLTVTTAREMTEKELLKIGDAISKEAEVTPVIDPEIIGGVVIKTDDMIFDGSIKTQLSKLKSALI